MGEVFFSPSAHRHVQLETFVLEHEWRKEQEKIAPSSASLQLSMASPVRPWFHLLCNIPVAALLSISDNHEDWSNHSA